RLAAKGRTAPRGEAHDVGAARDLTGRAHRVVTRRIHEHEALLFHRLGIFVDRTHRAGPALGGGAERLLQNGREPARLVAGRRIVVHLAAVALAVGLPPLDALHQLLADRAVDGAAR